MSQIIDADHDEALAPDREYCPKCGKLYAYRVFLPLPEGAKLRGSVEVCSTGRAVGYVHRTELE